MNMIRNYLQNRPELQKQSLQATCACQFQMSKQLPSSNKPKELKEDNIPICLNLRSLNATHPCPEVQPKLLVI